MTWLLDNNPKVNVTYLTPLAGNNHSGTVSSERQHLHAVGEGFHPPNAAQQLDYSRRRPPVFAGVEQVTTSPLFRLPRWAGPRAKKRKGRKATGKNGHFLFGELAGFAGVLATATPRDLYGMKRDFKTKKNLLVQIVSSLIYFVRVGLR